MEKKINIKTFEQFKEIHNELYPKVLSILKEIENNLITGKPNTATFSFLQIDDLESGSCKSDDLEINTENGDIIYIDFEICKTVEVEEETRDTPKTIETNLDITINDILYFYDDEDINISITNEITQTIKNIIESIT